MLLIIIALVIVFIGWVAHKLRTRRLRNALGREVRDSELTSLNSWMEASEKMDARSKAEGQ